MRTHLRSGIFVLLAMCLLASCTTYSSSCRANKKGYNKKMKYYNSIQYR